jgi:PRTRC genetic system protein C
MALTVSKMTRIFQFQGIRLPDPNPAMSIDEVKALYYTRPSIPSLQRRS